MSYIEKGTREFKLTSIALFAGGFNTFAILYSTQPLMRFYLRNLESHLQ